MKVQFNNPRTGQVKSVKLGWSWSLFLSGGLIGLPLFLQGLCIWGAVMASLWALGFIIPDGVGTFMLSVIGIGLTHIIHEHFEISHIHLMSLTNLILAKKQSVFFTPCVCLY